MSGPSPTGLFLTSSTNAYPPMGGKRCWQRCWNLTGNLSLSLRRSTPSCGVLGGRGFRRIEPVPRKISQILRPRPASTPQSLAMLSLPCSRPPILASCRHTSCQPAPQCGYCPVLHDLDRPSSLAQDLGGLTGGQPLAETKYKHLLLPASETT